MQPPAATPPTPAKLTLYPDMELPAYFEMDGLPVRIMQPDELPEKRRLDGQWEDIDDPYWSHKAQRITEEDFRKLVNGQSGGGSTPAPQQPPSSPPT